MSLPAGDEGTVDPDPPPPMPAADGSEAIAGLRWVLLVQLGMLPLSFATNAILGNVSSETIGVYGAIQVFVGGFQTFFVFGGGHVFTRLVPGIPREDRLPFLVSYSAVVLALAVAVCGGALVVAHGAVAALLDTFGGPTVAVAAGVALSVLALSFSSQFLYAVMKPVHATLTQRVVVLGYFVATLIGLGGVALAREPSWFLWRASLTVYAAAAVIGIVLVSRTVEFRARPRWRFVLPPPFWSAASYTHLQTFVSFLYATLAPAVVLLWLDLSALGHLHAALRYDVLFGSLSVLVGAVVAPGLSALDTSGLRQAALRRAGRALEATLLVVTPLVVATMAFAEDAMAVFGPQFRGDGDLLRLVLVASIGSPVVYIGAGMLVAFGAFRAYLLASCIYVGVVLGLTAAFVPVWGVPGAAAGAMAGALLQQAAIIAVLRALGFEAPTRIWAALSIAVLTAAASEVLPWGRWADAGLLVLALALFARWGRVRLEEVTGLLRRLVARAGPRGAEV